MTEEFAPGTRVRIAADATYGWAEDATSGRGGESLTAELARGTKWGDGPWEGVVQYGPDDDGDYRVALDDITSLYARRDYVTEVPPLSIGTHVRIDADVTHHLVALLRAITTAGYRATEVEAAAVPPCGTITIRVEQA